MIGFIFLFFTLIIIAISFCEETKIGRKFADWLLRKFNNSGWHYED